MSSSRRNRGPIHGNGPEAIARLQTLINFRNPPLGRVRGLFVCDETGRWLATAEPVNPKGLDNNGRDYSRHHAQSDEPGLTPSLVP